MIGMIHRAPAPMVLLRRVINSGNIAATDSLQQRLLCAHAAGRTRLLCVLRGVGVPQPSFCQAYAGIAFSRSFSSTASARASTEGESAPESRPDYYRILGVERSASPDDIKSAFRELAKKYHPDVVAASAGRSVTEAEVDFFKLLNEAYTVLSDAATRAEYDSERYSRRELLRRRNEGSGVSGSVVGGRIVSFGRTAGRALTADELETMTPEEAFQKGVARAQERAREHAKFRGAMARAKRVAVEIPSTQETIMRQLRPILFVCSVWIVALAMFVILF